VIRKETLGNSEELEVSLITLQVILIIRLVGNPALATVDSKNINLEKINYLKIRVH